MHFTFFNFEFIVVYYPPTFPRDLESHLITLMHKLQKEWQTHKRVKKLVGTNSFPELQGRTPPFWWYQFILLRHEKKFDPSFAAYLHELLVKTKIRSISGVSPLTLFTKGVGCPFHCIYCPSEPNVPKSYLSDEPAVMRAIRSKYNPYIQTQSRLIMFALSGHSIDKIEVIIKGGTFSFLPRRYRTFFIKQIYNACNTNITRLLKKGTTAVKKETIVHAQTTNETAPSRIIGINIETRPDYITTHELRYLRRLGVTHVELGVQTIYNDVYTTIKRGHTIDAVIQATRLLRDAGFKTGYHLMPNLPGSSPERDTEMMRTIFEDPSFKPDHLKLYPTTITKFTQLAEWYKKGLYKPYDLTTLVDIIVQAKKNIIPPWVRIGRLTRDITTTMMAANRFPPNLREIIQKKMHEQRVVCHCIRCREIQLAHPRPPLTVRTIEYQAAGGKEFFIEKKDADDKCLGFIRLRFPSYLFDPSSKPLFPSLAHAALIRELHVYGKSTPIGEKGDHTAQHKGVGEELLELAELKVREHAVPSLAIIAGIGVREYYRKKGYALSQTYMVKKLV